MTGNVKFELSSVSPDDSSFSGSYLIGQQGNYPGPNLDRSGSFHEGSDGRSFSSGTSTSISNSTVVADLPPLSKCLLLKPTSKGDQKYSLEGELRRALGFSLGSNSEDNIFGAAQSKPSSTLAIDELKRFRASVHEGCQKARIRKKRWDESFNRLNKYYEALISKKQQPNERSGGSNLLKMGTQSHRSSPDLVTQKLEERNKNIGVNKRARTPVGDLRVCAEGRSNGVQRQHLALLKEKDTTKDGSSDNVEENIRILPAGGEGWDKNMKRKRSVSNVFPRPVESDGELKKTMHSRLGNDSGIQASDSVGFRSGSSNSANGIHKLDGDSSTASFSARMAPKKELEKPPSSRELTEMNKERVFQKGNSKLNMPEDTRLFSGSSVTKGKSSRAYRTVPAAGNSSSSFPRLSETPEDWEQPLNVNKVHSLAGVNHRKRPLPTESSSVPMAQWVGQRPQKISRNRRTNILSPTSHDEAQVSSEGSDLSVRLSGGTNGSLPVRNTTSSSQQLKVKLENAPSPTRLSESEENLVVEQILKDKILHRSEGDEKGINGHQPSVLFTKKSKLVVKEEIGKAVHRQGPTGRGSLFSMGGMSPLREKLQSPATAKPVRSTRPGSEKNGSKAGRPPLKKQSDRKGFTRLGALPNSSCTGESHGREELLATAHFACNASYNGCSSAFWKRMEPVFYIRLEDKSFLKEQLKPVEEHKPILIEVPGLDDNIVNHSLHIEYCQPQSSVSEENKKRILDNGLTESVKTRVKGTDSSCRGLDSRKEDQWLTPLYQIVLSALIVEDEFEELEKLEENSFGRTAASLANGNDPLAMVDRISSNGNITHSRFSSVPVHEKIKGDDYGSVQPVCQPGPEAFQNDANGSIATSLNAYGDSSLECQYDQMCLDDRILLELQSFGIYPERVAVPAEGEDEMINQDIVQLKKQLGQQGGKKKTCLDRIQKAIQEKQELERRELEHRAMNQLTELSFKKLLATRGSSAARTGVTKVSRQVALTFVRRTLARCRKFEGSGKSCFSEPSLRDVLFAAPNNFGCVSDSRTSGGSERGPFDAYEPSDHAFAKNGPILNRGKKKEVLLHDVGGNAKGRKSDKDSRSKAGRPSLTGERKTKLKPKQKASQTSTHPVQPSPNISNILDSSKDRKDSLNLGGLPLPELDSIEDLGVANEFGGHEDLSSWLNFDEDGLQDIDTMGLEIPMDDLSELNMLM